MIEKSFAYMKGGRIYTLKPWKHPTVKKTSFRWQGFCDGWRCGLFKTKKDFEEFVDSEPDTFVPLTKQAIASMEAEHWAAYDGNELLKKFTNK